MKQLAVEFARAGGDVTQTFTYASTEGMLEDCIYTVRLFATPNIIITVSYSLNRSTRQPVILHGLWPRVREHLWQGASLRLSLTTIRFA